MLPPPPTAASQGRATRHSSFTDNDPTPLASLRQRPEMTYFLADEGSLDAGHSPSLITSSKPRPHKRNLDVESLESTISSLTSQGSNDGDNQATKIVGTQETRKNNSSKHETVDMIPDASQFCSPSPKTSNITDGRDLSPAGIRLKESSRPVTPAYLHSPVLASTPGSLMSRRGSETDFMTDDAASQAIMSSGEEDAEEMNNNENPATSQLVMPSLSLPSRKPFTEKGKTLGRLKILIAGDSGKAHD